MVTKTDQKGTRATVPKVHFSDAAMIVNKAVYYAFPQISKEDGKRVGYGFKRLDILVI